MGRTWTFEDKRNMALALVGFLAVMAILITGGVLGSADSDNGGGGMTMSTENPDIVTTEFPSRPSNPYRLPAALIPSHYTLKLQPFLSGDFKIEGSVMMELEVVAPTSNVTFHMIDLTLKNESVTVQADSQVVGVKGLDYDADKQWTVLWLERDLEVGQMVTVAMDFTGVLNDQMRGFYRSSYTEDGQTNWIAVSQFESSDARRAFPCLDEPSFKATFAVSLARETHMMALSNMPLLNTEPMTGQEGWVWDNFQRSVRMSTYLVAFVVADFSSNFAQYDNIQYAVWTRKSKVSQTKLALTTALQAIEFYQGYFSVPYVLPKLDMVGIPDFSMGAMENWGLVTCREKALFYEAGVSSASQKQQVKGVVYHELAHQWFGNLVTPEWWNDIWLNEGFATYMSFLAEEKQAPEWMMGQQMVIDVVSPVMRLDSLPSSHPISTNVSSPDEIGQIFDAISYDKGASIIRMMTYFLSEATFTKGITKYINDFQFSSATQDDLWEHMTWAGHKDGTLASEVTVKDIMDTWTLQKGYPVLSVTRMADGLTMILSQHHFLLTEGDSSTNDDIEDYRWWIPVSYTTGEERNFNHTTPKVWLSPSDKTLTLTSPAGLDTWVIVNVQQAGYYRVTYDPDNWDLIVAQMETDHGGIQVINRMQVIDDALNLARAGLLSYDTALGLNSYLERETEYGPWSVALSSLSYLEEMMTRTAGYGAIKDYLLSLLNPLYDSVGFEDDLSDPHMEQLTRSLALDWTCHLGNEDCLNQATANFNDWIANGSLISSNVMSSVLCTGVSEGGVEAWEGVWNYYLTSDSATESVELLYALGCSKEMWLLSRSLELAFTEGGEIRKQDSYIVFESVAANDVGHTLAWTFLRNNWDSIVEYYGSSYYSSILISAATREFNTEVEMKELEQFQTDHEGSLEGVSNTLSQAMDSTQANIKWMDRSYDHIVQWLEDNGFSRDN